MEKVNDSSGQTNAAIMASMVSTAASPETSSRARGSERLWGTIVGQDLTFVLARANARAIATVNTVLAEFDLKVRSYSVLSLAADDARPSQRELSEFLRLDPSQIVSLVDDLESRGLARREPDPTDRRANVVVATEAGLELHRRARRAVERTEAENFRAFSADDLERLAQLLRRVASDAAEAGSD
jgi:DNA-binding MarR family transcriptional regulator